MNSFFILLCATMTAATVVHQHSGNAVSEAVEESHGQGQEQRSHSFANYQGPLEGPHHKIVLKDDHGHDVIDYIGTPKYKFEYGVEDWKHGDAHGQRETRHGDNVEGEYYISEPGGNVRKVSYTAGKHGFHALIHNSDGSTHQIPSIPEKTNEVHERNIVIENSVTHPENNHYSSLGGSGQNEYHNQPYSVKEESDY